MKTRSQFKTLREYVDAQPRAVTQREISERLGFNEKTFSRWVNGGAVPKSIARRLSRQLGIPLENLLYPESVGEEAHAS